MTITVVSTQNLHGQIDRLRNAITISRCTNVHACACQRAIITIAKVERELNVDLSDIIFCKSITRRCVTC